MSEETTKRSPGLTSMEGMICNANMVLTDALRPSIRGVPKGYFMTCAGICIMTTVQAGMIFSGSVGTGIFMRRNLDGSWSNPVAVGISGIGFGFVFGANVKDVIIFFPDDKSIETMFSRGVELSASTQVTAVVGREFEGAVGASGSGTSALISYAYSKGAFIGLSMQGAIVGPRTKANETFYGPGNSDPAKIIQGEIQFPTVKPTLIDDVKEKLDKCAKGISEKPSDANADAAKVDAAMKHAEEAAGVVNSMTEVQHVDIAAEASKEQGN